MSYFLFDFFPDFLSDFLSDFFEVGFEGLTGFFDLFDERGGSSFIRIKGNSFGKPTINMVTLQKI
jgi:hypothetical protein